MYAPSLDELDELSWQEEAVARRTEPLDVRIRDVRGRSDNLFSDEVYARLETRLSELNELSSIEEAILSILHDERLNSLIRGYAVKAGIHDMGHGYYGRGTCASHTNQMPLVLYETGKAKGQGYGCVYIGPDENATVMPIFVGYGEHNRGEDGGWYTEERLAVAEKGGKLFLEKIRGSYSQSHYIGKSITAVDALSAATGADIFRGLERVMRELLGEKETEESKTA